MKKLLALIVLVVPLLIGHTTHGEELMVGEDLRHERILLPPAAPDRSRMVIRDTMTFVEEGNGAGIFVFYDDPRIKTDVDYIEMYDVDGGLLLVAWIDRFGICQVAMDRGLLLVRTGLWDRTLSFLVICNSECFLLQRRNFFTSYTLGFCLRRNC